MGVSELSFVMAQQKTKELQNKTGKSYNECSSALHLADGDVDKALKIMRQYPDHQKRTRLP